MLCSLFCAYVCSFLDGYFVFGAVSGSQLSCAVDKVMEHELPYLSCLERAIRILTHSGEARNSTSIASDHVIRAVIDTAQKHTQQQGSMRRLHELHNLSKVIKYISDHFLTINPAVCTWRFESNAMTLTFALGNSLLQASISRITSFGSVHPNIGNLYSDQYLLS